MRKIKRAALTLFFAWFCFSALGYSLDKKEAMREYFGKVNRILIDFQLVTRDLSQNRHPMGAGLTKMKGYLEGLKDIKPPKFMARQHKMISLSIKKIRMGFYLLSRGNKSVSTRLVMRGRDLLKMAANDIIKVSKELGLVKKKVDTKE